MIKFILFSLSLIFAAPPKFLSSNALTTDIKVGSLVAKVEAGFHFNEKAPNIVTVDGVNISPKKFAAREVSFNWPQKNPKSAKAYLYICDDENTFCEPRTIDLITTENAATATETKALEKKAPFKINSHGFIQDDMEAAHAKALKSRSLIMVDFAARWCPGCVRLENEVFHAPAFKKASKNLVKIRMDFDKFENLALAKKYNIKFIPTLLILDSDLNEITRLVDYQPLTTVKSFIQDAQKQPDSLIKLKEKVDKGEKSAALLLGQRLYSSAQYTDSVTYLIQASPEPIELRDAQVQAALQKITDGKSKNFVEVVKKAIVDEPQSTRSLTWRTLWIENITDKDEKKKIAKDGLDLADELLKDQKKLLAATKGDAIGEFTGFESLLIAARRADLLEAAEFDEAKVLESYILVADIGQKLKIPAQKSGPALRYLIFLVAAKKYTEAGKYVQAMLKLDPKNPELKRRQLRVLLGLEKFPEAIQVGQKLIPQSFGKNEVWVAMQLAKAYAGAKKPQEAKALAQTYLSRSDIEWSAMPKEKAELTTYIQ
ncbi:MAG: thioredoxin family protein [Bdellovibrionota bacterium]